MRFPFLGRWGGARLSGETSSHVPSITSPPNEAERAPWEEMARAVESLAEVAREMGVASNEQAPLARVKALLTSGTASRSASNFPSAASMSNEVGRWQQGHDPRFRPYTPLSTDALRTLARTYDVLAACIHHLKSEVVKVPLLIVPRDGAANTATEQDAVTRATAFFGMRGGLGGPGVRRAAFEGQLLDDLLILGACAVNFEFQTRGDWLDGIPSCCRALDASTIRPLVSGQGFPLADDEPCYEQWVNGVVAGRFSRQELWYEGLPTLARTDSPYFLSLVELAAMTAYTALKSDEWNRAWLTDGNGRGKYIKLNESVTPDQAAQWLEIIDIVTSGNARERHKLGAVPGDIVGSDSRKDADFQAFEHWLATRVMSVLGVNPASIGFNGGQYEANQEAAMGATREGTVAQLLEWRSGLYDDLLERLGFPFLQVVEDIPPKPETPGIRAERQKKEIESGLKTLNEVRRENGLGPVEGGDITLVGLALKPLSQILSEGNADNQSDARKQHEISSEPHPARNESQSESQSAWEAELGRWERKCLNRLARGQSASCDFESQILPWEVADHVLTRLEALDHPTRDEVRDVFRIIFDGKWWHDNLGKFKASQGESHPTRPVDKLLPLSRPGGEIRKGENPIFKHEKNVFKSLLNQEAEEQVSYAGNKNLEIIDLRIGVIKPIGAQLKSPVAHPNFPLSQEARKAREEKLEQGSKKLTDALARNTQEKKKYRGVQDKNFPTIARNLIELKSELPWRISQAARPIPKRPSTISADRDGDADRLRTNLLQRLREKHPTLIDPKGRFEPHHLIPKNLAHHQVISELPNGALFLDHADNGLFLRAERTEHLPGDDHYEVGETFHCGGHPAYIRFVKQKLDQIGKDHPIEGDDEATKAAARQKREEAVIELREKLRMLMQAGVPLHSRDGKHSTEGFHKFFNAL